MVAKRGEIWWAELGEARGSRAGHRRPVIVVSSDRFNRSAIATLVVVPLTSNLDLAAAPGNVLLGARETRLAKDSVAVVSLVSAVDKDELVERVAALAPRPLARLKDGLRLVLEV